MADDVGHALDVDVDDLVELLRRHLPERGVLVDDGGVVDEQVGRAPAGQQPRRPRLDLALARHVHQREIVSALVFVPQGLDRFARPAAAQHRVAQLDELLDHCQAQAAGRAGHHDYLRLVASHGRFLGSWVAFWR